MNTVITDLDEMALTHENRKYISTNWKENSLDSFQNFSSNRNKSTFTDMSSNLLKKKKSLEKKLNLQLDEIRRIEKELQDIKSDRDEDFMKDKLDLYQLITKLTWDLESVPNDVRGYVPESKSRSLQAYENGLSSPRVAVHQEIDASMNIATHSKFYIVNYLWELISGEVDAFSSPS